MKIPVATAREVYPGVRMMKDYARRQGVVLSAHRRKPWAADGELIARVDHNRWLANCGCCDAGIALTPGWNEGRCFECGAVYRRVRFPGYPEAIARALAPRPLRNRNWLPHETLDVLRAENIEHGVWRV